MTARTYRQIERLIIAAMLLSIVAMFQPLRLELYSIGFHVLLVSTIIFTVFSHFQPKSQD
jgi:hypothetical protein